MDTTKKYPLLEINLNKISDNTKYLLDLCNENNISISAVVKGVNADEEVVDVLIEGGCNYIASSRLEQLISLKKKVIENSMAFFNILPDKLSGSGKEPE